MGMRRRVSMTGRHLNETRRSLAPTAGARADASQVLHATCLLQLFAICAARFCVGEANKLGAARSGSGLNGAFASCRDASIWASHGQREQECKIDRRDFQAADET